MKWTKELPKVVGWYWMRREYWTRREDEDERPYIVEIRKYGKHLAIGNSRLDGFGNPPAARCTMKGHEWAGPIPEPED